MLDGRHRRLGAGYVGRPRAEILHTKNIEGNVKPNMPVERRFKNGFLEVP